MSSQPLDGLLRRALIRCLLSMLMVLSAPPAVAETAVEPLKVAYLYNFTRFIDWPDPAPGSPFVIAVLDDAPLAEALRALEREHRRAEDRSIAIREISATDRIGDCQILFVGAAAQDRLPSLLAAVANKPILLVGDSPGLARRGIAINFFLKPDILGEGQRLRFEMNPAALAGRGLKVSSQLYDVARVLP
ncbi:YfiR family protein [Thiorhodococcus mannitoliphagus]|uniref:YfiR family protein n=1 Tax=Thiorhodococcus mannitoliphagus TaxID=329406 RepID=A0A6P1DWG0_9GAMM|nr:YfiR family protein [Thiorhodococcus mannitoliphagus]NEX22049.1 YfiR family protein [Thiorhodococcus mannitoliphagus]